MNDKRCGRYEMKAGGKYEDFSHYVIEYKSVIGGRVWPLLVVVLSCGGMLTPLDRESQSRHLDRLGSRACRFVFNSASSCRCSFLDLVLSHHIELLV